MSLVESLTKRRALQHEQRWRPTRITLQALVDTTRNLGGPLFAWWKEKQSANIWVRDEWSRRATVGKALRVSGSVTMLP